MGGAGGCGPGLPGLESICQRTEELNLTAQQKSQAEVRAGQADDTVRLRIAAAYIWALVPEQSDAVRPVTSSVVKAEGAYERLAERVTVKLRQGGLLATTYGARNVRMDLDGPLRAVWERGHVSVGDLWSYYRRYPYLARLRDRSVLEGALRSGLDDMMWESEGFALAESYDDSSGRYGGLATYQSGSVGTLADSVLVVHPALALAQFESEQAPRADRPGETTEAVGSRGPGPVVFVPGEDGTAASSPGDVRFFAVARVNPERYGRDFTRIAQEVLQHLTAVDGTKLDVTVEITATNDSGFPPDKVRVISENARTLKFEQFGFEDR